MEITTVYQKERQDFGRAVYHFRETNTDIIDEFLPEPELLPQHVERSPTILDIQAIPDMSEMFVNTETVTYKAQGMVHLEGGWPKDVDSTEKDQTQRYKKKVEKDDDYIKQIKALGDAVEGDIKQNYAIDIYQEYFAGEYADHSSEPPSAKTLSVFKDPSEVRLLPSGPTHTCRLGAPRTLRAPAPLAHSRSFAAPLADQAHRLQHLVVSRRRQEAGGRIRHPAVPGPADRQGVGSVVHLGREQPEHARDFARAAFAARLPRVQPEGPESARGRLVQRPGLCV